MQYPYIKDHGIEDLKFQFFTLEATDWYDPLKPYTLLEYQWVRENVRLENQVVIDAGAHHGNYAVVFKGAYNIVCYEMIHQYCVFCYENLKLNGIEYFSVDGLRLSPSDLTNPPQPADIYKMDIEGMEFQIFALELERNPQVHTWILELHPTAGDPNQIAFMLENGFDLLKVDRESMTVRPYVIGEKWPTHATLIARK